MTADRTWDGKPVATTSPRGAMIVVVRQATAQIEYLLLHRAQNGPEHEGDWAWTPPSGARYPGESIEACARRELKEETGLEAPIDLALGGNSDWFIYLCEVSCSARVRLHDQEHDRYAWMKRSQAESRCKPSQVADGLALAAQRVETASETTSPAPVAPPDETPN